MLKSKPSSLVCDLLHCVFYFELETRFSMPRARLSSRHVKLVSPVIVGVSVARSLVTVFGGNTLVHSWAKGFATPVACDNNYIATEWVFVTELTCIYPTWGMYKCEESRKNYTSDKSILAHFWPI